MMRYTTFIFDLDGTLLDTLNDLAASVNYALRQHGMAEHPTDDIRRFVGNGVRLLMQRAVPADTPQELFEAAYATFRQHYMEHSMDTTRPYDGIPETLSELRRRGCRIAVVSNKMQAATQKLVAHFFPDIPVAIGENEAAGIRKKPAPDTVFEALRQLEALPAPAPLQPASAPPQPASAPLQPAPSRMLRLSRNPHPIYVGDSDVDILTARNASLPCISVLWGFRSRQFLIDHGATNLVAAPAELIAFT